MPKRTCKTTISLDKDVKARLVGLFESSEVDEMRKYKKESELDSMDTNPTKIKNGC